MDNIVGKLTLEQIVTRIETELLPNKAKIKVHDYEEKITLKVWSAKNGLHLYTVLNLPVQELQIENYLSDVIKGITRELEAKSRRTF